jgi:hypothetical protein
VGASVAVNNITSTTQAFISGSTVTSETFIGLEAKSSSHIVSVTAAGAGGGGGGVIGAVVGAGAGSGSDNRIHSYTHAYITNNGDRRSTVTATNGGDIVLSSRDGAIIEAIAGSVVAAGGGGAVGAVVVTVGASAAQNAITSNTSSYVTGADVYSLGTMKSDPLILDLSDAGKIDDAGDTIDFGAGHGFRAGDAVVYTSADGKDIGGLGDNARYYVILPTSEFDPLSQVDCRAGKESISIGAGHGYSTGDSVVYHSGSGGSIGGLEDGKTYYVIAGESDYREFNIATDVIDAQDKINLGLDHGYSLGDAVTFHGDGIGTLTDGATYYAIVQSNGFDPDKDIDIANNTIQLGADHSYSTGDAVRYESLGGDPLGWLEDGKTYYIIVDGEKVKLAKTAADAAAGKALSLDKSSVKTLTPQRIVSADRIGLARTMEDGLAGKAVALDNISSTGNPHSLVSASKIRLAATKADALADRAIDLTAPARPGSNHFLTSDTRIKLAETRANGLAGGGIDIEKGQAGNLHTFTKQNEVSVTAESNSKIVAVAAAGAVAGGGGAIGAVINTGAGAASRNSITNTIEAYIEKSLIETEENSVALSASDHSSIEAVSGAAAAVGGGGLVGAVVPSEGVSLSSNYLDNNVITRISESTVTSGGDIALSADSDSYIWALSVAGSFSGSGGIIPISPSGSGSEAENRISKNVKAYIYDDPTSTRRIEAAGALTISAVDESTIRGYAASGSLALTLLGSGLGVAVGASVAENTIDNDVLAYISGADVTASSVDVSSRSDSSVETLAVAAAISANISLAANFSSGGASATNTVTNNIMSYVDRNSTVTANGPAVDGGVTLTATDESDINSDVGSGALAFGVVPGGSVGVSIADTRIENNVKAYIDDGAVTAKNGDIVLTASSEAVVDVLAVATSIAVSSGGLAGAGGRAKADIENRIAAYAGANSRLSAGRDVKISSSSNYDQAKVECEGIGGGFVAAIGGSVAEINIGGATTAYLAGTVTGANGAGAGARNLTIESSSSSSPLARAVAVSGGILSGAGADADALVNPEISAYTGANDITVSGSISITSVSEANADGLAVGVAAGGLSVGVSLADATITPDIKTYIGGGTITAPGGISLQSRHNTNEKGEVLTGKRANAHATAPSGALIGGNGADATADASARLDTHVDSAATLDAGASNIKIESWSYNDADAGSEGITVAAVSVGASLADAAAGKTGSYTRAYLDGAVTNAGWLTIDSKAVNDAKATAVAVAGGIGLSGAGADADAHVNPEISAYTGTNNLTVSGGIAIKSVSEANADADAVGVAVGGGLNIGVSLADATITPDIKTYIGGGTIISGGGITLRSRHNANEDGYRLAGKAATANASAPGGGVLVGSGNGADATAVSSPDLDTYIGAGANVSANGGDITVESFAGNQADADAKGLAISAGVSVGATLADATIEGSIKSRLDGTVNTAEDLTIHSRAVNDANATTQAVAGGIYSGAGADSDAHVSPTILAATDSGFAGTGNIAVTGKIEIASDSFSKSNAGAAGVSAGVLSVGVSLADATVTPKIDTYIGGGTITADGGIMLRSRHNIDETSENMTLWGASAHATSPSGALIGGNGADATADGSAKLDTFVGSAATLDAKSSNIEIQSLSFNQADAGSEGITVGGVSVGASLSDATAGNADSYTTARMSGKVLSANNLEILSKSVNDASGIATAVAGGIVSGAGADADAHVGSRISAYTGTNDINVSGGITITSLSEAASGANAVGVSAAGDTGVGVSLADATVTPEIKTFIEGGAITADQGITLGSYHNYNKSGGVPLEKGANAHATAPGGALRGSGAGADATSDASAKMETYVGAGATLQAGSSNITIQSLSNNDADATSEGISGAIVASVGAALADATAGNGDSYTKAHIDGAVESANNLTILSKSSNDAKGKAVAVSGGIVLSGAGADADAHVSPTISAYTGTNNINVSGGITISSLSESNSDADAVGVSGGGGLSVGVSLADATLTPMLETYIAGGTITADQGITLGSYHNYNVVTAVPLGNGAKAHATAPGGSLLGSGVGADAVSDASAWLDTYVDSAATLNAGSNIKVVSLSNNDADAGSEGISGAIVASVGAALADAKAGNDTSYTKARIDGTVTGALDLILTSKSLNDAKSTAHAVAGGLLSGAGADADARARPNVRASTGTNDITVSGNLVIKSFSETGADAKAVGESVVGGAAVGGSLADAVVHSNVHTYVGGGRLQAGKGITLGSYQNDDGRTALRTYASGSSGVALLGITGTSAIAGMDSSVITELASGSRLYAGGDVHIVADSRTSANVQSIGKSNAVFAYGSTSAAVDMKADTQTRIGNGVVIDADGAGEISAKSVTRPSVYVEGGKGRSWVNDAFKNLISGNIANFFSSASAWPSLNEAGGSWIKVDLDTATDTSVGEKAFLKFGRDLRIGADSEVDVAATAVMKSGSLVGPYAIAVTDIAIDADARVTIGEGAKIEADNLTLLSDNLIDVGPYSGKDVLADASGSADIAGAFGTAISRVNVGSSANKSTAGVLVANNAWLKAQNKLIVDALNHSDQGALQSLSRARADAGIFVATATASAEGSVFAEAKVEIGEADTTIHAHDADVRSQSSLTLSRAPDAAAAGLIKHVETVIDRFVDDVITYLPWPLNWIVSAITHVVREVARTFTWFEFSKANTNTSGTTSNSNTIVMNGDVYIGYGDSKKLIIREDGSIDPASNINVAIGGGKAVVQEIESVAPGRLSLWAPGGAIAGSAGVFLNSGGGGVLMENYSGNDLVIGKVDLLGDNTHAPQFSKTGSYNNTFNIQAGATESSLAILNHSSGDIELTGLIDNRPGTTTIRNEGGSISAAGGSAVIQTKILDLESDEGDIGSAAERLQVELYQRNTEYTEFSIRAGNDVYADIMGMVYLQSGAADAAFKSYARDLSVGGMADLKFVDGGKQTFDVSNETVISLTLKNTGTGIDLEPTTTGGGHSLVTDTFTPTVDISFDPAGVYDKTPFVVGNSGMAIEFDRSHGFVNGEAVVYSTEGNSAIAGLTDGESYYVVILDTQTIGLACSAEEAGGATFGKSAIHGSDNTIDLGYDHGFATGEMVIYSVADGTTVSGLVDGQTYYVEVVSATSLRLARSREEAQGAQFSSGYDDGAGHSAAGAVDPTLKTITFGYRHGFSTGDAVVYDAGGSTPIGNLTSGAIYYVEKVDDYTIKVKDAGTTSVDLILPAAGGATHSIRLDIDAAGLTDSDQYSIGLFYDQASAAGTGQSLVSTDSITFASNHGFTTGEAVVYGAEGNSAIGELVDGSTYYVVAKDADTIRLAVSEDDARNGVVLSLDPTLGSGTGHSFSSATKIALGHINYFETGQAVVYSNGGGGNHGIGGLFEGKTYYVVNVPGNSVVLQLAESKADALAGNVLTVGTHVAAGETGHSFGLYFDSTAAGVNGAEESIDFGYGHSLQNGEAIVYVNAGPEEVGDLVSGRTYYVAVANGTTIKLAPTQADALSMFGTVKVVFDKEDLGTGSAAPNVTVAETTAGGIPFKTVTITLNTNPSNPTTAQDLVEAIDHSAEAGALIDAELIQGPGTMVVADKYFGDGLSLSAVSDVSRSGSYTFTDLSYTGEETQSGTFVLVQGLGAGMLRIHGGNSNIELAGMLDYAEGSVAVDAWGDIRSTHSDQLILAGNISLVSIGGAVGDSTASINIQQTGGALDVFADDGVFVNAATGDLRVGWIESNRGVVLTAYGSILEAEGDGDNKIAGDDISLTVLNGGIGSADRALDIDSVLLRALSEDSIWINETSGDLNVNLVVSTAGDVSLDADGSILDYNNDTEADIRANSITLHSRNGGIGAAEDDLEIDSSFGAGGLLNATAAQGGYLTEAAGPMNVGNIASDLGDVRLTIPDTSETGDDLLLVETGSIRAGGDVYLRVGDNIRILGDIRAGGEVNIQGDFGDADAGRGTVIDSVGTVSGSSVALSGGADDDEVGIVGLTAGSASIKTYQGNDTVYLGRSLTGSAFDGMLGGIDAPVTVDGGGQTDTDRLILDNSADSSSVHGTITEDTITGFGMGKAGRVEYLNIESLNLLLGSGDDTINVQATASGAVTSLNTGAGDDVINVSSDAPGSSGVLDGIWGILNVDAGGGDNTLNLSDAGATVADTSVVITEDSITGLAPAAINYFATGGTFGGGIDITLGAADDRITIVSIRDDSLTTIRGNEGNESITVEASVTAGYLEVRGDAGNDEIDASAVPDGAELALVGGLGKDTLSGGQGNDVIFGDDAVILRDGDYKVILAASAQPEAGDDDVIHGNGGNDIIVGGSGKDTLRGGDGNDILIGDNGRIQYDPLGVPVQVESIDLGIGGADTLNGGEGDNVIVGGHGGDGITTGAGDDIVFGDNGRILYKDGIATDILTTDTEVGTGGGDTIDAGDGDNIVFGGVGSDRIASGSGDDLIFGDNGRLQIDSSGTVQSATSTELSLGGDDTVDAGDGDNAVFGGTGNDTLKSGSGDDTIFGDSGEILFSAGFMREVRSTDKSGSTGNDRIEAGAGADIVISGPGDDTIRGGDGNDILIGDEGRVILAAGFPIHVSELILSAGGSDNIHGEGGADILIGGPSSDTLLGGTGFDVLFGDGGTVILADGQPRFAYNYPSFGGAADHLDGGPGTDVLFGGEGVDSIIGRFPEDGLVGEFGSAVIENWKIVSIFPPVNRFFSGLNPVIPGSFGVGSVLQLPGAPVFTAIFTQAQPAGVGQSETHAGSYGSFGATRFSEPQAYSSPDDAEGLEPFEISTRTLPDGSTEKVFRDGTVEITAPDGTLKRISPDGTITVFATDGSVTLTTPDGTVRTTFPDGTTMTYLTDGTTIRTELDGSVTTTMPDGTVVKTMPDGTILTAPPAVTSGSAPVFTSRAGFLRVVAKDRAMHDSEIEQTEIGLGAVVAGMTGWGLSSIQAKEERSLLHREGFKNLERESAQKRFRRWGNGKFVHADEHIA